MPEDKRKQYFCPEHKHQYLYREGDEIICCGIGCSWKVEAKREEDSKIPTREDWHN